MKTFFEFEFVGANSCGIQLLLIHENCFNFCNFSFDERNKTSPQKVIVEDLNHSMVFRCAVSLSTLLPWYKLLSRETNPKNWLDIKLYLIEFYIKQITYLRIIDTQGTR